MRAPILFLFLAMSLGSSGCLFKKKKPAPPPPPMPAPVIKQEAPPLVTPPPVDVETSAGVPAKPIPEVAQPQVPPLAPPPAPPKQDPKPAPRRPQAPKPAEPAEMPPPQLGEVLPESTRWQYERQYQLSLDRTRAALEKLAAAQLSRSQQQTAERARTFLRQAEEMKGRDLAAALQLIRRADLLASDLAGSLR